MKYIFKTVIIILTITSISCVYEPWKRNTYVNKTTKNINKKIYILPDIKKYSSYYIGSTFIDVRISPTNDDLYVGDTPYVVTIEAKSSESSSININNIHIKSGDRFFDVSESLPIPLKLKKETYSNAERSFTIFRDFYTLKNEFSFEAEEHKSIIIELDIDEIESALNKQFEHALNLRVEKGIFRYIN